MIRDPNRYPFVHVYVRRPDGPLGERRYDDVYRTRVLREAREIRGALERADHREVILRSSAVPPGY